MNISYEVLLSVSLMIVKVFGILILGYFIGRLAKVLIKIVLKRIIGVDKWLDMKGIKVFRGEFSEVVSTIVKDFIYLISFAYALIYSGVDILISLGNIFIAVLSYLFIIAIIMIMVHLLTKVFLEDILSSLFFFGKNETLLRIISIFIYTIALIVTLDYLGLLSKALLYIFLIVFGGFVIFVSVMFGIAYGDKIRETIKK